ncbi:MAG: sensor histidine kinase [Spirochaetia bacterium]
MNIIFPASFIPVLVSSYFLGPWWAVVCTGVITGVNLTYLLIRLPGYLPEGTAGFVFGHVNILLASSALGYISRLTKHHKEEVERRKRSEAELIALLSQKEIMVREMNHRITNHLNMLAGMIELQSDYMNNDDSRQKFRELRNRIVTMSLVHRQLQKNSDDLDMDTRNFMKTLIERIAESIGGAGSRIPIHTDIEELNLSDTYTTPLALIISEVITNAFKYAFPEERSGSIWVSLRQHKQDRKVLLKIKNDGVPFEEKRLGEGDSLGMTLIRALTNQIGGVFTIDQSDGFVEFLIEFSPPDIPFFPLVLYKRSS